MKRIALLTLTMAASCLIAAAAGRNMRGGAQGTRIFRSRRVSVSRPAMPSRVISGRSRSSYPTHDGSGARISKPIATAPPAHHARVVSNGVLVHNIEAQQRREVIANHYYWHNDGGMRYSHYYDGHDHWYGFYHGPTFYWTRYYGGRWWWYGGGRWDFWWNGFWWWPGPGGVAYAYIDGNYYPYEDSGVTVTHEETQAPPASIPAADTGTAAKSPDGSRLVQISGSDGQAFLYDNTAQPPKFVRFLGAGASKVRFSGGTAGAPLQILVEYKDDTFALFDSDGNSQKSALQTTDSQSSPPAAPDAIPPPPTSAPGQ